MSNRNETFRFYADALSISKAKDKDGKDVMRLGGIASTNDEDTDGEFLDPTGFNTKYLEKSGIVNWHHGSKNNPDTIIGEPSKVDIRPEGLYVEVDLYDSDMARKVYGLAQTFEKSSKTRRLGFSIEGKATERDKANPKIIKKANITGLAITHMPKNPNTLAQILKGQGVFDEEDEDGTVSTLEEINKSLTLELKKAKIALADQILKGEDTDEEEESDEDETEKSLSTDSSSGQAIVPSHVDGQKKKLTKGEVYEAIFSHFTDINVNEAKKTYQLILKTAEMAKRNAPTNEDINKAFGLLSNGNVEEMNLEKAIEFSSEFLDNDGNIKDLEKELLQKGVSEELAKEAFDHFSKAEDDEDEEEDDEDEEEEVTKGEDEKDEEDEEDDEEEEDEDRAPMKKSMGDNDLLKAINSMSGKQDSYAQATGTIMKSLLTENEELKKGISDLQERLGNIEGQSNGRKSIARATVSERNFDQGHIEKAIGEGKTVVSMKENKRNLLNILEKAAYSPIEKGVSNDLDPEFEKALSVFEAAGIIENSTKLRLNREMNVLVTA